MKKIILFCFLISYIIGFSQNVEVTYAVSVNTNDPVLATSTTYNLWLNDNQSVYFNTNDSINQFKYKNLIFDVKQVGELTKVQLSDNHFAYVVNEYFFKDYQKDTLIYNDIILNKKVFVGENTNLFSWKIIPNSETILLGFKCQKASAKFRGRTYEATFSTEIASFGGPWKFDGLPGLILEVRSLDNYFVIEPIKVIKDSKVKNQIKNIYNDQIVISWNTYKKTLADKLMLQLKKLQSLSENGEGGSIKITEKIENLELPEMKF